MHFFPGLLFDGYCPCLAVFRKPSVLFPIKLSEMKANLFRLWPESPIGLCFGSTGSVYILNSREHISSFVCLSTLALQLFLIGGLNHYPYEAFLILISGLYLLSKCEFYLIYGKYGNFRKFDRV